MNSASFSTFEGSYSISGSELSRRHRLTANNTRPEVFEDPDLLVLWCPSNLLLSFVFNVVNVCYITVQWQEMRPCTVLDWLWIVEDRILSASRKVMVF